MLKICILKMRNALRRADAPHTIVRKSLFSGQMVELDIFVDALTHEVGHARAETVSTTSSRIVVNTVFI